MNRFIEGEDRSQSALLPPCLDDYMSEENPVRVVDAFVGNLARLYRQNQNTTVGNAAHADHGANGGGRTG